ncbi:nucleotidyltransferase domain-containing protein [Tuwongella immobilis]|uniref:Nucleotidyltransferase n=1 Tax=Tuwongella immobilis TaxID=692036 RepID=A0A6C2YSS7_9BACT
MDRFSSSPASSSVHHPTPFGNPHAIDPHWLARIDAELSAIELREQVRILYAVESGSRAWGFPSQDSDYDVRFLYVRPRDWYLSIRVESQRDVIECPLDDLLDCNGWDLRKALQLFAKANPSLTEWLQSPIVYRDCEGLADRLRGLQSEFFSPVAALAHYLSMARGNFRTFLQGPTVKLKKYFYVLRPVLAARWLEQGRGIVPMPFAELLTVLPDDAPLRADIESLLAKKLASEELDSGPRIDSIHEFLTRELERLSPNSVSHHGPQGSMETLDALFRDYLKNR